MKDGAQNRSGASALLAVAPVLTGFFVMGFVDVIGVATNFVKRDFALTETVAGFLPSMVFLWFFVCSLPTAALMNRVGRKNAVLLSMAVTLAALALPIVSYTRPAVFAAFALLGVGNAMIQVAQNPLVSNVVRAERLTSCLSFGQFVKSVASLLGPVLATAAAARFGNWRLIFPAYAGVTLLAMLWLWAAPIPREGSVTDASSFGDCLRLLADRRILALFAGVVMIVGFDVGMNVCTPAYLQRVCGLPLEKAGLGSGVYFAGKMAGAFAGALFLTRFSAGACYRACVALTLAALAVQAFTTDTAWVCVCVFVASLGVATIFSVLFGWALQHRPAKANEVSSLLVMGVSGGAVIPPVMGAAAAAAGPKGMIAVLLLCVGYLLALGYRIQRK